MIRIALFPLLVFVALLCASSSARPTNSDAILSLPGLTDKVPFKQYAGYITVDEEHERRLFYWFAESQNDPSKDPVVLWLNGGPGCSSILGLMSENGPFWADKDGKAVHLSPTSWNKVANMLYLESPAGVGFSYSRNTSDYTTGDAETATDAYVFLTKFFALYPQFAGHDFYVSGESYGGHYVPNLAHKIAVENRKSHVGVSPINLKGFLVGNAWTDPEWDNRGTVEHWYSHALISKATHDGIMDKCDFPHIGPLYEDHDEECGQLITQARTEMGNIDIYDIYEDLCLSSANHAERIPYAPWHLMSTETQPASPCIDNWVSDYLNRVDVQEALHVDRTAVTKWNMCSAVLHYSDSDLRSSMIGVYHELFEENMRIMVYSGDVDGIVPVYGSRLWIDSLDLPIVEPWRHWMVDSMVGGYVQKYDKLTFTTVRGAGHMVPGTQPDRALAMFTRFIQDQPM